MTNLFDELRKKIEQDAGKKGISAWELTQLPAHHRRIIRHILREVQIPYHELRHAMSALPATLRLEPHELDEALNRLTDEAWIIRMGQGQRTTFRVNLRHKRGSGLSSSMWEHLNRRLHGSD